MLFYWIFEFDWWSHCNGDWSNDTLDWPFYCILVYWTNLNPNWKYCIEYAQLKKKKDVGEEEKIISFTKNFLYFSNMCCIFEGDIPFSTSKLKQLEEL